MSGHSMLRSGCGCLVSIVLIIIAIIVGLVEMNAPPAPPTPQPTPTSVRSSGALSRPLHSPPGRAAVY
jgi:hypothetical protein